MVICDYCGTKNPDTANFCCICAHELREKTDIEILNWELSKFWNGWKIIERIGHGSYGNVYLAEHSERNCVVHSAIKVINVPKNKNEFDDILFQYGNDLAASKTYFSGVVDNCIREVQVMASIKSALNVVYIEDFAVRENDGDKIFGWKIFIRMELLTSFNEYRNNKILTEKEIIKVGIDICTALELLEKQDILHRDIKPQNMFVNNAGIFKIGDFGIARQLENSNPNLTKRQGTSNYMAPEVYKGLQYDYSADVYSFGLVLYELANNNRLPFLPNRPFADISDSVCMDALQRRMSGEALPKPGGVSEALAGVILKACAFNPNKRLKAAEMKNALLNINLDQQKNAPVNYLEATNRARHIGENVFDIDKDPNNSTAPTPSKIKENDNYYVKTQLIPHSNEAVRKDKKSSVFGRIFNFDKNNQNESYDDDFTEIKHTASETVLIADHKYSVDNTYCLNIINRKLTKNDLQNIGKLKNLTTLNLIKCSIKDILFMISLVGLESLCLTNNHISYIAPLRNLTIAIHKNSQTLDKGGII